MATWYVASNITPGDNSGIDMVPNPGTYADLVDDDKCLVSILGVLTTYTYDATSALTESLPQVITPNGNPGNGRWILSDFATSGQNGFAIKQGPQSDSLATIGVVGTTFTLTHVADYDFYIDGVVYRKTGNETVEITDVHGLHWIYFDSEGTLQIQAPGGTTDDLILDNCLVAAVYWDAVSNAAILLFDERHGNNMSPATHYHLHETLGALYETGIGLSGFSVDGTGNDAVDAQFDIDSGEFHDEDNEITIPADADATIDTFFRQGAGGPWFKLSATAGYPVADGQTGTQLDWNDYNGGAWQLQEVPTISFVLTHYFATNDTLSDAGVIGIMGQNTYLSLNAARTGAETEIGSILLGDLPLPEILPIATVIWQTAAGYSNQVAARIRATSTGDDYIDWRQSEIIGSGSSSVDHESLSGLLGGAAADHYHITAAQHTSLTTGVDEGDLHLHDSIDEGNSKVEVVDAGSGTISIVADGNTEVDVTDAGMRLGAAGSRVNAILDEDDMASDSATSIATQQSIKAYVRDNAGDPALPKLDFYQDWLQRTKYLNASVLTCVTSGTLVDTTTMDHNIEEKRYDFTAAETLQTDDLYDSTISPALTNITECIIDAEITDSVAGTLQVSNNGGSTWVTVTDTSAVQTFVSSGIDLVMKYTAGGTGYIEHMGVLYNPDTIHSPATEVVSNPENTIINGDFEVWQRGTSFAAIATSSYSADRFAYHKSGTMVHTVSRSTTVPTVAQSGHGSYYSIKVDCTTADAALGVSDYTFLRYNMEGVDFHPHQGSYGTLSFWVRATKVGTYCVSFGNSGSDRTYIAEYSITTSDTWEKKTVTVNFNDTGGTWDYTTGIGLKINFILGMGSTYHGSADTWSSSNLLSTSNQVNSTDSTDNDFYLSQVRFERGQVANTFESRHFTDELSLCNRYYQTETGFETIASVYNASFINSAAHEWSTIMRATPTVVLSNLSWLPGSGGGWGTIGSLYSNVRTNKHHSFIYNTVTGTLGYSGKVTYDYTASAEL